MISIIRTIVKPKHPLTEALISFVSTQVGWRVYMGIHCRLREIIYDYVYVAGYNFTSSFTLSVSAWFSDSYNLLDMPS